MIAPLPPCHRPEASRAKRLPGLCLAWMLLCQPVLVMAQDGGAPGADAAPDAPASEPAPRLLSGGVALITDSMRVLAGGEARGGGTAARADVWIDGDGGAIGLSRLTVHGDLMAVRGVNLSQRFVGDAQGVSSIQAATRTHIYEAWARWQWSDNAAPLAVATKVGLIDLNSEFDVQAVAALFVHSSHGVGADLAQSGENGPSIFPMPGSAVVITAQAHNGIALRLGAFDALAGSAHNRRIPALRLPGTTGALLITEVEVPLAKGEVQAGLWRYTRKVNRLEGDGRTAFSQGGYAMIEQPIGAHTHAWLRVGGADPRSNPVAWYAGGGVVREMGPWQIGLAVAQARLGRIARQYGPDNGQARHHETAMELSVAGTLAKWLTVQPNLHYVINPGWKPGVGDALAVGLRLKMSVTR